MYNYLISLLLDEVAWKLMEDDIDAAEARFALYLFRQEIGYLYSEG